MMTRCIVFLLLAVLCQPLFLSADVVTLKNGQKAEDAYVLTYSRNSGEFECAIGNQTLHTVHAGEIASITFSHQVGDLLIEGRTANVTLTDENSYPQFKLKSLKTINGQMMFIGNQLDVPDSQDIQILANNVLNLAVNPPPGMDKKSLVKVARNAPATPAATPTTISAQQQAPPPITSASNNDQWDISYVPPTESARQSVTPAPIPSTPPRSIGNTSSAEDDDNWDEDDEDSAGLVYQSRSGKTNKEAAGAVVEILAFGVGGFAFTMVASFLFGGFILNRAAKKQGVNDLGLGKAYICAGLLSFIPPTLLILCLLFVPFCILKITLGLFLSGFSGRMLVMGFTGVLENAANKILFDFYSIWVLVFVAVFVIYKMS